MAVEGESSWLRKMELPPARTTPTTAVAQGSADEAGGCRVRSSLLECSFMRSGSTGRSRRSSKEAIELAPEDALRYADLAWVAAG